MGRLAKFQTGTERNATKAKKNRNNPRKREYDIKYRQKEREQSRSQRHANSSTRLMDHETQETMLADSRGCSPRLEANTPVAEGSAVLEAYDNPEVGEGIS